MLTCTSRDWSIAVYRSSVNSRSLIAVMDFRRCRVKGAGEGGQAKLCFKRSREFKGKDVSGELINDGGEVCKSALKSDIGDIGSPYVIWTDGANRTKQVGIFLMQCVRHACIDALLRVYCLKPHRPHEPLDVFSADTYPLVFKRGADASRTVERIGGE